MLGRGLWRAKESVGELGFRRSGKDAVKSNYQVKECYLSNILE